MRNFPDHYSFDEDFFYRLPKTDLHVHLDGSLRLSTILELAEKDGIDLGEHSLEQLKILSHPEKFMLHLKSM